MSRVVKDFYKVLGVEKDATKTDIKKAYRRLAANLHPDVNTAEDAQERFNEVTEAYKTLSDDEARKDYDNFLETQTAQQTYNYEFQDVFDMFFQKSRSREMPINGKDINIRVGFTVQEALKQEEKEIFIKKHRVCKDCRGKRYIRVSSKRCTHCEGEGKHKRATATPFGRINTSEDCEFCSGTGYAEIKMCDTCEQSGWIPDDVKFKFKTPEDVFDGKKVVFKGEGEPGRNGGESGNLFVEFYHQKYDRFTIEYQFDVVGRIDVSLKDALEGGKVNAILPDGEHMELTIPKGTKHGSRLSVQNLGLLNAEKGIRGNYYIEFNVVIPTDLSDKQIKDIVAILNTKGGEQ